MKATAEELEALMKLSRPTKPVMFGYGTGVLSDHPDNQWAIDALTEMRETEKSKSSDGAG